MNSLLEIIKEVVTYFTHLGVDSRLSQQDIRITKLINQFTLFLLTIIISSFFFQLITHLILSGIVLPNTVLMLLCFIPFVVVFVLNHKRKYAQARLFFVLYPLLKTLLWMFTSTAQSANIHYSFLLYPIPIIIFFKKTKTQIILILTVFIFFVGTHIVSKLYTPLEIDYTSPYLSVILFGSWMVLSFFMLRFFTQEMEISERQLNLKNKELEDFTHIVTHDLKEPLRSIKSFSTILSNQQNELSDRTKEYLGFIESGAERMDDLLNDLSDYSMVNNIDQQLESISLDDIFYQVQQNLLVVIHESNATIEKDDLPNVQAIPSHMIQLFQNIISNGIKFQSSDRQNPPKISIKYELEEEYHAIHLTDNGIGIPQKDLDKIFSKFKRLHSKEKYVGTGLGLATCKKIMEYYNGKIKAKSILNQGTTISLFFAKQGKFLTN